MLRELYNKESQDAFYVVKVWVGFFNSFSFLLKINFLLNRSI